MRTTTTLALLLSSALALTACGSSVKLDDNAKIEERSGTTVPATADSRAISTVNTGSTDPLNDPKGILAKRSVYFDYDSYIVKDEFKPVVDAHAKYLVANKGRKIVIQGNTDERGGREYNLALGQKRAEAVRKSLSLLGVSDAQMEAVSFGKEKPKATGSDEAAWAENRRADLAYQ
ncbi:peptidoglycan-associated lipoprotein Pal [Noviherbaspirillum sp. Root189]|jgi:peptidoglycan-associated lipoprotein|uniref:peptidoglycan-associated lipoprotein Pal n=1 Tax=Noviherbaspirillum sp. Root189 TaxID=1736487 RepID=UPI00071053E8|nr:peptidoglycan-associated lipoprotein Pal [Noviherbaspirillum sp. Root189]KRB78825.1 cell envelope biogenesis protein OmpA [Noviherbaspirillum sp. Root189]